MYSTSIQVLSCCCKFLKITFAANAFDEQPYILWLCARNVKWTFAFLSEGLRRKFFWH
jgi:hypothetical protein